MIKFSVEQDILKVFRGRKLYALEILDELNLLLSKNMRLWRLYPILKQLEKEDLISSEWGEESEDSDGARRKYYRITSRGIAELQSCTSTESFECDRAMDAAAKA
jgi:PadR family transcriptional regulator, regulatory protein PadR